MSSYLASKFSTPSDAYLTSCIEEQKECGRGSRLGNCCNGLKCHQSDDKYICQDPLLPLLLFPVILVLLHNVQIKILTLRWVLGLMTMSQIGDLQRDLN